MEMHDFYQIMHFKLKANFDLFWLKSFNVKLTLVYTGESKFVQAE